MLKQLMASAAFIIVGFAVQSFLPWWSIAIVGALFAIVMRWSPALAFGLGTAAGTLLWVAYANVLNFQNQSVLSRQIAEIFTVSAPMLFSATGLIGGLVAGLGALTGSWLRVIIFGEAPTTTASHR